MGTLKVVTSSSLTRLAASLANDPAATPASPLGRETVVVLNPGMARWLSLELATIRGVSAALDFPFPNEILDSCFRALIPGLPDVSPFTRDAMAWRIAARLPSLLERPGFGQIAGYLGSGNDDRRLLQIARTLADLFDQYVIFRPEMVLAWDKGRDDGWQSVLWREISADCQGQHRAAQLRTFRERIGSGAVPANALPRRISLFGISYLPPFHLDAFSLLARHSDVVFYLQNPCGSYWGDIVSRRRLAELALREPTEAEEYYDTGNPLLSSLGTMGQEFHDMLLEFGFDTIDLDNEEEQPGDTLLKGVRNDIRRLRDSGGRDDRISVPPGDRSLRLHSCHGPLREMEVLHDNLLAMFDEPDGLEPRQVLVMIPDIESYAPYIAAVFGAQSGGRPAIPFTIADRSRRRENQVLETFFRILGLPASRFGVNQVLELLESPPVLARFAVTPGELEAIRAWLAATSVRWGLDEQHRAELGFPPFGEFSWQAALERLFLGYALEPDSDRLFRGILPFEAMEGRSAVPLGKLAEFLQTARGVVERLAGRRTLQAWADTLTAIALELILPDDENGLKPLFGALHSLRDAQQQGGFNAQLGLEAVRECLTGLLDEPGGAYGFLGGRVTFCAMLPMRSIPFRVICLAGMNDGVFPRNKRQPGFSLMAGKRRRGDRSLRDEDRYLFLETIMAAGERLHISYTGQSDRDNSVIPPSVVVAELLDYVERGFRVAGTNDTPPPVLVRHRLQAFSADYFSGGDAAPLFSYSTEYRDALRLGQLSGPSTRRFITEPLPDDPELLQGIDLRDLARFLANPAAAFLARRLGVRPYNPGEDVEEREPFALEGLAAYGLRQELVNKALSGAGTAGMYEAARARALLPPLGAGQAAFAETLDESLGFARLVAPYLGDGLEPLPIACEHEGMALIGVLREIRSGRHLRWRSANMKAKDRLGVWVEHLLLNALAPDGYPRESLLICRDQTLALAPLPDAAAILNDLLELYREGLRKPLPFFPQASWLFLTEGMERAQGRWSGGDRAPYPAEAADPAFSICFGDAEPLDWEFEGLARRVFGPLRAAAIEEKEKVRPVAA